ncbi:MAG: hypothetical protein ACRDK1_10255 [Solirubrobacterales bacterium]
MNRSGPALFCALVVATVVTAAVVVHARTPDLALQVTHITHRISPQGGSGYRAAHISFFVRYSDPDATVEIVGPNLKLTKTLYRGPLVADRPVSFTWNGRTAAGAVPNPNHRYRLRVILPGSDRDMVYPRRIDIIGPDRR